MGHLNGNEIFGKQNKNGLTEQEIDFLKDILKKQKQNLVFKDKYSCDFNLAEEDLSDEVDHANADTTSAQQLRFRNRENFYEKKIDEALRRMEKNEYGLCKECDRPIKFGRLRARPTAELCINCKEEAERDEMSNYILRQSKSRGRSVNLFFETREAQ